MKHISKSRRKWLLARQNQVDKLYKVCRIYGPYKSKDGRYRVVLKSKNLHTTKQYAKLKVEIKLGRRLNKEETIDHKDRNVANDKFKNLKILPRSIHAKLDALHRHTIRVKCNWCKRRFSLRRDQYHNRKSVAGPFCSKTCTGKYGAYIQNGGKKNVRQKLKIKCYRLSKD